MTVPCPKDVQELLQGLIADIPSLVGLFFADAATDEAGASPGAALGAAAVEQRSAPPQAADALAAPADEEDCDQDIECDTLDEPPLDANQSPVEISRCAYLQFPSCATQMLQFRHGTV